MQIGLKLMVGCWVKWGESSRSSSGSKIFCLLNIIARDMHDEIRFMLHICANVMHSCTTLHCTALHCIAHKCTCAYVQCTWSRYTNKTYDSPYSIDTHTSHTHIAKIESTPIYSLLERVCRYTYIMPQKLHCQRTLYSHCSAHKYSSLFRSPPSPRHDAHKHLTDAISISMSYCIHIAWISSITCQHRIVRWNGKNFIGSRSTY